MSAIPSNIFVLWLFRRLITVNNCSNVLYRAKSLRVQLEVAPLCLRAIPFVRDSEYERYMILGKTGFLTVWDFRGLLRSTFRSRWDSIFQKIDEISKRKATKRIFENLHFAEYGLPGYVILYLNCETFKQIACKENFKISSTLLALYLIIMYIIIYNTKVLVLNDILNYYIYIITYNTKVLVLNFKVLVLNNILNYYIYNYI